jgi:hypothetical protein
MGDSDALEDYNGQQRCRLRTVLFGLALCLACLAATQDLEVVVPPSVAHPQDWLRPQIRKNPKPGYQGKSAGSLAEFVAPEVISKIVVDQYAGPPDDVRRYLTAMPPPQPNTSVHRWISARRAPIPTGPRRTPPGSPGPAHPPLLSKSGRTGKLAVATVFVSKAMGSSFVPKVFGLSRAPDCVGLDEVPVDSLYVRYVDPDGYTWSFAVPLQRKK